MNDFNQSETQMLPGFEEYQTLNSGLLPSMVNSVASQPQAAPNGFDPFKTMMQKKAIENGEVVPPSDLPVQRWPEKDTKALEEFCTKHGIVGFNCGRMSPIAALAFLKNHLGIVDAPLEERVPNGYTRLTPYSDVMKKVLLKG